MSGNELDAAALEQLKTKCAGMGQQMPDFLEGVLHASQRPPSRMK
jgi:hypothetical protein